MGSSIIINKQVNLIYMITPPAIAHQSIHGLKQAFRSAQPITADQLTGQFKGFPAGPWWFRLGSGPTLGMSGFGGWLGKQFLGNGKATNLFMSGSETVKRFPMTITVRPSQVDGKDTFVLLYPKDARAPWCWVTDELRMTADGTILGLTFVDAPVLRYMVFPFVLRSSQQ
jgi:hypothetical protein